RPLPPPPQAQPQPMRQATPPPRPQPEWTSSYPNPDLYSWTGVALGLTAGTLGVGAEATVYIQPWLNLRAGYTLLKVDFNQRPDSVKYIVDVDIGTPLLALDFLPFEARNFRISAGLALMDDGFSVRSTPQGNRRIGENTYTPEQMGTISGDIDYGTIAPYVGIGYGNPVRPDNAVSFAIQAGVLFISPELSTLQATGSARDNPAFRADLERERETFESDLNSLKVYPVISFTLSYHF
ncbi:MAG TPA: hypothetical protein PKE55_14335, partial [Kiritimatiellia bacterium]|nr:hypothetical protein [Kiritimatiellia bacterium]